MDNSGHKLPYGTSVFTTMRMVSSSVMEWDSHFDRLRRGIDFISGTLKPLEANKLKLKLEEKLTDYTGNHVLRLSIDTTNLNFEFSRREIPPEYTNPIKLRSLKHKGRISTWPSYLKAEINLEARKTHLKADYDDILFLSEEGFIEESSIANIFILKDNILMTPKPGPNVLEGIIRNKIIKIGATFFDSVLEHDIKFDDKFNADAVFLSNSVRGVFLVDRIDEFEITYTNDFLKKFVQIKDLVMK